MKEDKATCPYCDQEFIVKGYGYGLRCPLCKKKVDIFPDPDIFVTLPFGTIGISGLQNYWRQQE